MARTVQAPFPAEVLAATGVAMRMEVQVGAPGGGGLLGNGGNGQTGGGPFGDGGGFPGGNGGFSFSNGAAGGGAPI